MLISQWVALRRALSPWVAGAALVGFILNTWPGFLAGLGATGTSVEGPSAPTMDLLRWAISQGGFAAIVVYQWVDRRNGYERLLAGAASDRAELISLVGASNEAIAKAEAASHAAKEAAERLEQTYRSILRDTLDNAKTSARATEIAAAQLASAVQHMTDRQGHDQ